MRGVVTSVISRLTERVGELADSSCKRSREQNPDAGYKGEGPMVAKLAFMAPLPAGEVIIVLLLLLLLRREAVSCWKIVLCVAC